MDSLIFFTAGLFSGIAIVGTIVACVLIAVTRALTPSLFDDDPLSNGLPGTFEAAGPAQGSPIAILAAKNALDGRSGPPGHVLTHTPQPPRGNASGAVLEPRSCKICYQAGEYIRKTLKKTWKSV